MPAAPSSPAASQSTPSAGGAALATPSTPARRLALSKAQASALRDSFNILLSSRALVWIAGVLTVLVLGFGPSRGAYHPPGLVGGFGSVGEVLAAPAARWDGAWYLTIAHYGYLPELGPFTQARAAFFPLYPLLVFLLSGFGMAGALSGVIVALLALLGALYALHRLITLELSAEGSRLWGRAGRAGHGEREVARLALLLTAFGPMAFFLSADYSESLYLALSIGTILQARRRRWLSAGVLGGLAAASRSTGVLLLLPVALLYLYGPGGEAHSLPRPSLAPLSLGSLVRLPSPLSQALPPLKAALTPRFAPGPQLACLLLIPAGLCAYIAFYWLSGGEPLAPFHAQALWGRHFAGPFVGAFDGLTAAFEGARQLLSGQSRHLYFPLEGHSPFIEAGHNLMLFGFLALCVPMLIGVFRRLPKAYGAYVLAALALPLSYPVATQPLMSLPRFLLVLFPLNMWLAAWLAPRRRLTAVVLGISALALAFFTAEFSTWHWVA